MDPLIELCEVTKRYAAGGVPALDRVSLRVAAGEAVAVMGPSGSGKSTLLNLVAGLDKPSAGTVTVAGQRIDTLGETRTARYRRTEVGMIFQFFNLVEDLTVIGNVMLPARLAGTGRRAARARAQELLTRLGIGRYRDTYPGRLSGGERQRVAIARALVNSPAVLLADEPTGAVDTTAGRAIGQLLVDLNAGGQTLLIVTHNPELAERYASRVIQLADGRVISDTATAVPTGQPGARAVRAAPVLRVAWAGAARRLVQSLVVFAVLAISSATAVTGLTLVFAANAGYAAAIAVTHGADLAVTINAAKVTAAQLAATRHLPGVTQDAGPYPQATVTVAAGPAAAGKPGGLPPTQLTVVGRASPSGPLDDIVANPAVMAGEGHSRWPARPGEISLAVRTIIRLAVGSKLTVTSAPGRPSLTVVGYGDEQVNPEDAWVVPSEIARLRAAGAPAQEQMLYTFTNASTPAQISADLAELKAALPRGAIASSSSHVPPSAGLAPAAKPAGNTVARSRPSQPAGLTPVRAPGGQAATASSPSAPAPGSPSLPATGATPGGTPGWANANTPFVLAFAVLGVVLAVLITANVVSAAVIASYRRIGVLKSIGFTPAQVTAAYLAQISIPAVAGAVAGTILGNSWVLPVIGLYEIQGAHVSVPSWINLAAPFGMLALAGAAAAVPAVRAGRLPAVAAITAGQAPRAGRGAVAYRLAARLRLPETVTVGLAAPFSRPARSAVTLAALLFGLTGVVLGSSLNSSIHKINHSAFQGRGQLQASGLGGKSATLTSGQAAAVRAAIRAQPGTLHYAAETDLLYSGGAGSGHGNIIEMPGYSSPVTVAVAGHPGMPLLTYAYDGDPSGLGWNLLTGRWYNGPGQVDVSTNFTGGTGRTTGDTITLTVNGKPVTVRIAGVVFLPNPAPAVFASWQTLGGPAGGLTANQYDITLKPGTSIQAYTSALQRALGPGYGAGTGGAVSFAGYLDTSLFAWLTVLVGVLAALGVLNAALMATRERVHDLGVFKAVGMTAPQTITMVICWVIAPAIIATAIALPAGLTTQDLLVRQLAFGIVLPGSFVHVLGGADLLLLALTGLVIAIAGALGPAGWAARTRTSTVLHTE